MAFRSIVPALHPLDAELDAPPSKSVTHRALVAAALASGDSTVLGPLSSDDTEVTLHGLQELGVSVTRVGESIGVRGRAGSIGGGATVSLRDSGTSMRLLLGVAALGDRESTLDGSARLRERPVADLAQALRALGARVTLSGSNGGLPAIAGGSRPTGGAVRVPGGTSSQFASALLLIAPSLERGLDLTLTPPLVSLPYVEITVRVLEAFGATVERRAPGSWSVAPQPLRGTELRVEGDHSTAAYFLAAAAVAGGRVRVRGLDPASAQPDARIAAVLRAAGSSVTCGPDWCEVESAGALRGLREDLTDAPDLAPTLAVLALVADGASELRGLGHLRHKESDRLAVVARNLGRLGCAVEIGEDRLRITPPDRTNRRGAVIETAADHRIAMAFAVAGLAIEGIAIDDAECVAKSNPSFWRQLERLAR